MVKTKKGRGGAAFGTAPPPWTLLRVKATLRTECPSVLINFQTYYMNIDKTSFTYSTPIDILVHR